MVEEALTPRLPDCYSRTAENEAITGLSLGLSGSLLSTVPRMVSGSPLPTDQDDQLGDYANTVVLRMAEISEAARIGDLRSRLQRLAPEDEGYQQAFMDLLAAESRRRSLRERVAGIG